MTNTDMLDNLDGLLDGLTDSVERKELSEYNLDTRNNIGGKGKKLCPECQMYSGVRTKFCTCGHEFEAKAKTIVEEKKIEEHKSNFEVEPDTLAYIRGLNLTGKRLLTVYTPSGKCPFSFAQSDITYDNVREFCEDIVDFGIQQSPPRLYLPTAISYWLRNNCPDKKWDKVNNLYNLWLNNIKGASLEKV